MVGTSAAHCQVAKRKIIINSIIHTNASHQSINSTHPLPPLLIIPYPQHCFTPWTYHRFPLHCLDLSGQLHSCSVWSGACYRWEPYNPHGLAHISWVGCALCRSWTTYHNGRWGSRWSRWWFICRTCGSLELEMHKIYPALIPSWFFSVSWNVDAVLKGRISRSFFTRSFVAAGFRLSLQWCLFVLVSLLPHRVRLFAH